MAFVEGQRAETGKARRRKPRTYYRAMMYLGEKRFPVYGKDYEIETVPSYRTDLYRVQSEKSKTAHIGCRSDMSYDTLCGKSIAGSYRARSIKQIDNDLCSKCQSVADGKEIAGAKFGFGRKSSIRIQLLPRKDSK